MLLPKEPCLIYFIIDFFNSVSGFSGLIMVLFLIEQAILETCCRNERRNEA